jgi:hypothetical protein
MATVAAARVAGLPILADVAAAYFLAFVALLFSPSVLVGSQPADIALAGAVVSSFIVITDPVNKALAPVVRSRILRHRRRQWAFDSSSNSKMSFASRMEPQDRDFTLVVRAQQAFWSQYLSKAR